MQPYRGKQASSLGIFDGKRKALDAALVSLLAVGAASLVVSLLASMLRTEREVDMWYRCGPRSAGGAGIRRRARC